MKTTQNEPAPYAIVIGVDYSALCELAVERACELAKAHERTELHVVHVTASAPLGDYGLTTAPPTVDLDGASKQLHQNIERIVSRWYTAHPTDAVFEQLTTHVRVGRPAEAIAQLASDVEADLIVVGTHGRGGAQRFLLGSVAEGTVRLAPCAVLVVRQPDAAVPQIEPPCPACLEIRRATDGKKFWCERHSQHHGHAHTFHYKCAPGSHQSSLLIHAT